MTILREQLPGNRLQNGESPAQDQSNAGERDQESTIAEHDFQQAAIVSHGA